MKNASKTTLKGLKIVEKTTKKVVLDPDPTRVVAFCIKRLRKGVEPDPGCITRSGLLISLRFFISFILTSAPLLPNPLPMLNHRSKYSFKRSKPSKLCSNLHVPPSKAPIHSKCSSPSEIQHKHM
ncbi:hypothetical protein L1887_37414 [Cichorium endivia]|nr:hypothetical protein L1887_37414 [Cichorium endivia]